MSRVVATALALLAILLIGGALAAMASGDLQIAGLSFLSASLVIYIRETRFVEE